MPVLCRKPIPPRHCVGLAADPVWCYVCLPYCHPSAHPRTANPGPLFGMPHVYAVTLKRVRIKKTPTASVQLKKKSWNKSPHILQFHEIEFDGAPCISHAARTTRQSRSQHSRAHSLCPFPQPTMDPTGNTPWVMLLSSTLRPPTWSQGGALCWSSATMPSPW